MVSENKIYPQKFDYKIKRPQTIIVNTVDNSSHYNRYITVGLGMPLNDPNYFSIEGTFQTEKYYAGASYIPELKSFGIRAGIPIVKFKKVKK